MVIELRALTILILIAVMILLSSLHSHMLGSWYFNYDINTGQCLIAALTFALVLFLIVPRGKLWLLGCILWVPLLCGILFSWGELLSEFDPHNISKGWGIIWLITSYASSFCATIAALAIKWLIFKCRIS